MKDISVFLGANTGGGFRSVYDEAVASLGREKLYVLKGSAGCGKSSLMKRIADRADEEGEKVLRILCSGDPDSLDGVALPDRGIAFFDGTSPHVLEPSLVGQRGFYLDLSRFYLSAARGLEGWDEAYREHYRKAYRYLAAVGSLEEVSRCPEETRRAIRRRAEALAARTLGRGWGEGGVRRLFTDAFTCRGPVSLEESRRAFAPKLIALTGGGERADLFMQAYLREALERGREVILCPQARQPERIAHLLLPELGLGITSGSGDRRIRLEKLGPPPSEEEKAEARELEGLRASLLALAQKELALAKADHDRLEAAVKPHIDFTGISELTDAMIREVFP